MDQEEKDAVIQMKEDYKKVFLGSAAGKRVLEDIIAETGIFDSMFTGNSKTFYLEGKRDIGLAILDALDRKSFDGVLQLQAENVNATSYFGEGEHS